MADKAPTKARLLFTLCALPFGLAVFGLAAWLLIPRSEREHASPVLSIRVTADGYLAVNGTRPAKWPAERHVIRKVVADWTPGRMGYDRDGLPRGLVAISASGDTSAELILQLIVLCQKCYITRIELESEGWSSRYRLLHGSYDDFSEPQPAVFGLLALPSDDGRWKLTRTPVRAGRWDGGGYLDFASPEECGPAVFAEGEGSTSEHVSLAGLGLPQLNRVYIQCDGSARASHFAEALAYLARNCSSTAIRLAGDWTPGNKPLPCDNRAQSPNPRIEADAATPSEGDASETE